MMQHGLHQMPVINSDGHLFEAKLNEAMNTDEDSAINSQNETGEDATEEEPDQFTKMRYKCYILPPIKYPDGKKIVAICVIVSNFLLPYSRFSSAEIENAFCCCG